MLRRLSVTSDASSLVKHAAEAFTPEVFRLVAWSLEAVKNCFIIEVLDAGPLSIYVVAKKDRREKKLEVRYEEKQGSLYKISCSCRKLEYEGRPCSHILYVLETLQVTRLPKCCVPTRWTMGAKSAYPPNRKSDMYEYSKILMRYHELRKLSNAKTIRACLSDEAYEHLKMLLKAEAASKETSSGQNECIRFGPVLSQTAQHDYGDLGNLLDPVHVQGRGAPKKRLHAKMKMAGGKSKCGYCGEQRHNRRTCSKLKEVANIYQSRPVGSVL